MKKNNILKICLSLFLLLLFQVDVTAVDLRLVSNTSDHNVGDEVELSMFVDTEQATINAIEGEIVLPVQYIALDSIRDNASIISLWMVKPTIVDANRIKFSGIVAGGFSGTEGNILTLRIRALEVGEADFDMSNIKILLNDGQGSRADVSIKASKVLIMPQTQTDQTRKLIEPQDDEPPESFKPLVLQNEGVYDGLNVLVFNTQDKLSGIDRYEIQEGDQEFEVVESPYLIKNQTLDKDIKVKAIDKAGNERTEEVYLSMQPVENSGINIYLIVGVTMLVSIIVFLGLSYRRWIRK